MSFDLPTALYSGLFALVGVLLGAAASITTSLLTVRAQEKQQRRQIQATAVQAEVTAFRDAVIAVVDQIFAIQDCRTSTSQDTLAKECFELDRRVHRLGLFGSTELIIATGKLQTAISVLCSGGPITGPLDPRNVELHKAKTVWLTRARKEIVELRALTLQHTSGVRESVQTLEAQMETLTQQKGLTNRSTTDAAR